MCPNPELGDPFIANVHTTQHCTENIKSMVPRRQNSPLVTCKARLKGLICCVFAYSFINSLPQHIFHAGTWGTADVTPPAHNTKTIVHLTTHCTKHRTIWKQGQNSNQHPSYVHDTNWYRNCEQYRDTVKTVTTAHHDYVLQTWSRNRQSQNPNQHLSHVHGTNVTQEQWTIRTHSQTRN